MSHNPPENALQQKSPLIPCAAFSRFHVAEFYGEDNALWGVPPAFTMINSRRVCHRNNENTFFLHSPFVKFSLLSI